MVFGSIETALILTLKVGQKSPLHQILTKVEKPLYDRGIGYPMVILGIIASVLLAVGLIFPYIEIWKRRGRVIGIDWVLNITPLYFVSC